MIVKQFNLYEDIMILTESGHAEYIGSPLLEDDQQQEDPASKKLLLSTLKEKIGIFKGDKEAINKVNDRLATMQGKKKSAIEWVKFIATKLMMFIGKIFSKIVKFLLALWKWVKQHVPGVQKIATKVDNLLFKNRSGEYRGFRIGDEKIATKDLIGLGTTTFVLIGSLGYIAKKVSAKMNGEGGGGMQESIVITTSPLVFLENDGSIGDSFTKKVPGIFAKLIDLGKNVKDAALSFFIKTLGVLIVSGLFILLLVLFSPLLCKMIKYSLGIEAAGMANSLQGVDKAKYISAKMISGMANILAKTAHMDIFAACDCIEYNKDHRRYEYAPSKGSDCPSIQKITAEIKAKMQKQ